jgi:hypothetical protein
MDYRVRWIRINLALLVIACPVYAAKFAHEYRLGRIRIFYDTIGTNAVDTANVEDIAKQTSAAYSLFVETLGFPDPFKTERFRGASFLDIHLLHKSILRFNGVACDELQRFKRPGDPTNTLSLCFNVATSVKASANLTPAHEFFHLIQYSTTYFKNAWYTEGMARWSEKALGAGDLGKTGPKAAPPALFKMSYDAAEKFWNPLAAEDDAAGTIPEHLVSAELKQLTYSTGARVLQGFKLTGWRLMRDVLVELDKADDVAFRELGYDRWSEQNQNSQKNNPHILRAVAKVARRRSAAAEA